MAIIRPSDPAAKSLVEMQAKPKGTLGAATPAAATPAKLSVDTFTPTNPLFAGTLQVPGAQNGGGIGETEKKGLTLTNGQKRASEALGSLISDDATLDAMTRGDGTDITRAGVQRLADAKLDDNNVWRKVPPEKRQGLQDAARILMGDNGEADAGAAFSAALAAQGDPNSVTLDEARNLVAHPDQIPDVPAGQTLYKGIKINPAGLDAHEVSNLEKTIDGMDTDPDGHALLEHARKIGMTFGMTTQPGVAGQNSGSEITFAKDRFSDGFRNGLMEVMSHELVHATGTDNGVGGRTNSLNEESLASTIGARIVGRVYGPPISPEVERARYYDDVIKLKRDGTGYGALPEGPEAAGQLIEDLNNLGITFPYDPFGYPREEFE